NVGVKEGGAFANTEFAFSQDYSMSLKLTKRVKNTIEGTIDLRMTKPANSNLSGTFTAIVKKTVDDPLDENDVPYVQGKIAFIGPWVEGSLLAGFDGKGSDGKSYSNSAGVPVSPGKPTFATSETFAPQL